MSFTSGTRAESGKPIDTTTITTAIDNSEYLLTRSAFTGCKVSGTRTISTSEVSVDFTGEDYDTDSWHDTVTNNTRLTVPSGISYVQLVAYFSWSSVPTDPDVYFKKNGSHFDGAPRSKIDKEIKGALRSALISVSASDYFELYAILGSSSISLFAEVSIRGFR